MVSVVMLNFVMLIGAILSVVMLNFVMLIATMLSVDTSESCHVDCCYAECHYDECHGASNNPAQILISFHLLSKVHLLCLCLQKLFCIPTRCF